MRENQLVRQSSGNLAIDRMPLKLQERLLLVELAITAENAKTELSPELQAEFASVFADEDPGRLREAFRLWRLQSRFIPAIAEIREIINTLRRQEYAKAREARDRQDRIEAQRAFNDPAEKAAHERIIRELGERLKLQRLPNLARRAPQNVKALSQAKALRCVGSGGSDAA